MIPSKEVLNYKKKLQNFIKHEDTENIKRIRSLKKDFDAYMLQKETEHKNKKTSGQFNEKKAQQNFLRNRNVDYETINKNMLSAEKLKMKILEIDLYENAIVKMNRSELPMSVNNIKRLANKMNRVLNDAVERNTRFARVLKMLFPKKRTSVRPPQNNRSWARKVPKPHPFHYKPNNPSLEHYPNR